MALLPSLWLAISHAGEYHPPSTDWGSVMLGAPTEHGLIGVDWNSQKGYVTAGDAIVHTWALRESNFSYPEQYDDSTSYVIAGQARVKNSAILVRQSGAYTSPFVEYAIVNVSTEKIKWRQMNCEVGAMKFRYVNNEVYMMDLGTGLVMKFDEEKNTCETVIDEREYFNDNFCGSTWGEDLDGIKLWSFALTEANTLYYLTRQLDSGDAIVGKFENGVHSKVLGGLYEGSRNIGFNDRVLHGYGDVFAYKDSVIVITGEVDSVFGPRNAYAQEENLIGKIIKIEPTKTSLLGRGVRHAFSSTIVNDSLYVADVGAWCFDEISVVNLEGPQVNLMWPIEEGVAPGWNADAKRREGVPTAPLVIFQHGCFPCDNALLYEVIPGAGVTIILVLQVIRTRAIWLPFGPLALGFFLGAFYTPWFKREMSTYTHAFGLWRIDQHEDIGCTEYTILAIVGGFHLVLIPFVISSKERLIAVTMSTIFALLLVSLVSAYRRDLTVAGEGQAPYNTDISYGVYLFSAGIAATMFAYPIDKKVTLY